MKKLICAIVVLCVVLLVGIYLTVMEFSSSAPVAPTTQTETTTTAENTPPTQAPTEQMPSVQEPTSQVVTTPPTQAPQTQGFTAATEVVIVTQPTEVYSVMTDHVSETAATNKPITPPQPDPDEEPLPFVPEEDPLPFVPEDFSEEVTETTTAKTYEKTGEMEFSEDPENRYIAAVAEKYKVETKNLVCLYTVPENDSNIVLEFDGTVDKNGIVVRNKKTLVSIYSIDKNLNSKRASKDSKLNEYSNAEMKVMFFATTEHIMPKFEDKL